jgi:hypothetical protein
MKPFTTLAVLFLFLIALAHLFRVVFQLPLVIGNWDVPMWMSGAATLFTATLAFLLWSERKTGNA